MAIANPVTGDRIRMTNSEWAFSIEAVRQKFGFETLLFINDFTALAMALPLIAPQALTQLGGEEPPVNQPIGLLGAGTGLGVSGLIPCAGDWVPLEAEGGHVTFSPFSEREIELLRLAKKQYPHVSAERFISGMGLELIYRLIMESRGKEAEPLRASDITARALSGECGWCEEVVETFCQMLGTVAGNLALTLGARGGIYIGGGIVPRLGERFFTSGFRQRFEEKGRFSSYLSRIPVYVIQDTFAALTGVSAILARQLAR
jgi:glucokinase